MRSDKRKHDAQVSLLEQQVNTLTEALEFYADPKTYRLGIQITMGSAHPIHEPIKADKGDRARNVLQSIKESNREEQGE